MKKRFSVLLATLLVITTIIGFVPVQAAGFTVNAYDMKVAYQPGTDAKYKVKGVDTVLEIPKAVGNYKSLTSFNKKMTIGCCDNDQSESSSANLSLYSEGFYGVRAKIKNNEVYVRLYSNISANIVLEKIKARQSYSSKSKTVKKLNANMDKNKWTKLYIKPLNSGEMDQIVFTFNGHDKNAKCHFFVYNDNGTLWLCKGNASTKSQVEARYKKFNYYMDLFGLTPKNTTDISEITYPILQNDSRNWRCDTERWAELGLEVVDEYDYGDGISDNYKAFIIFRWVVRNIAYDYYKVKVLIQQRDFYYDDHSGKYSTWNTRCGVCHDLAHAALIMLRANGIPAVIVDSHDHEWLAFWNNETKEWWEIDPTEDCQFCVRGEDVTKIERDADDWGMRSFDHSLLLTDIKGVDMQMWTENAVWNGVTHNNIEGY